MLDMLVYRGVLILQSLYVLFVVGNFWKARYLRGLKTLTSHYGIDPYAYAGDGMMIKYDIKVTGHCGPS